MKKALLLHTKAGKVLLQLFELWTEQATSSWNRLLPERTIDKQITVLQI